MCFLYVHVYIHVYVHVHTCIQKNTCTEIRVCTDRFLWERIDHAKHTACEGMWGYVP